ncbi:MAG: hypothetical protein Q7S52_01515 [bacterium]|nr:hypothetical protein [bacterium]
MRLRTSAADIADLTPVAVPKAVRYGARRRPTQNYSIVTDRLITYITTASEGGEQMSAFALQPSDDVDKNSYFYIRQDNEMTKNPLNAGFVYRVASLDL